ncbi:hypothetical protein GCM10023340_20500 [Nocardioides marinquilinus]|uniref:SCP domain-containing protein n=1 Tax=Nocardioides marinquilinus TaxID=1210400 RepID=A0ABP9PJR1_9ACTN
MQRSPRRSRTRLALAVVLASLPLSLTAPAPAAPAPTPAPAPVSAQARYVDDVWSATQAARRAHDRTPFRGDRCLRRAARAQAARMARTRTLTHSDLGAVARRCGLRAAAENVAFNPAGGDAVVRAWLRSPGHRANLLHPGYRLLGVAGVRAHGTWWAVQVFGRR